MTLLDILDITDIRQLKVLDKIVKTFSGFEREWTVKTKDGVYSKHFRISRTEELLGRVKQFANGAPYELHMSVQLFNSKLEPLDWTFIIDIDAKTKREKGLILNKVRKLLDKFGIFYLVDNHYHIWIPDWEHSLIENWNSLYGDEVFVESLALYLEKVARIPSGSIDRMLWKAFRHPIRMPYSPHLEGDVQKFIGVYSNLDDWLHLWDGSALDHPDSTYIMADSTYDFAVRFKTFINKATEYGRELLLLEEEEESRETYGDDYSGSCTWMDRLLETSIPKGYRGKFLWMVITPYLVNVKKLTFNQAKRIVDKWLELSKADRFLDRDLYNYLPSTYKHFKRKQIKPCRLSTLRRKYKDMHKVLIKTKVVKG